MPPRRQAPAIGLDHLGPQAGEGLPVDEPASPTERHHRVVLEEEELVVTARQDAIAGGGLEREAGGVRDAPLAADDHPATRRTMSGRSATSWSTSPSFVVCPSDTRITRNASAGE